MDDEISRNTLLRYVADWQYSEAIIGNEAVYDTIEKFYHMVEEMPSVQPEIIRCKDCMHNGSFDTDCQIDWNGKEYCSFAERKEDE